MSKWQRWRVRLRRACKFFRTNAFHGILLVWDNTRFAATMTPVEIGKRYKRAASWASAVSVNLLDERMGEVLLAHAEKRFAERLKRLEELEQRANETLTFAGTIATALFAVVQFTEKQTSLVATLGFSVVIVSLVVLVAARIPPFRKVRSSVRDVFDRIHGTSDQNRAAWLAVGLHQSIESLNEIALRIAARITIGSLLLGIGIMLILLDLIT